MYICQIHIHILRSIWSHRKSTTIFHLPKHSQETSIANVTVCESVDNKKPLSPCWRQVPQDQVNLLLEAYGRVAFCLQMKVWFWKEVIGLLNKQTIENRPMVNFFLFFTMGGLRFREVYLIYRVMFHPEANLVGSGFLLSSSLLSSWMDTLPPVFSIQSNHSGMSTVTNMVMWGTIWIYPSMIFSVATRIIQSSFAMISHPGWGGRSTK